MGKQRKQRQQPSKKKVQVKQKISKQDSSSTAAAKKVPDPKIPEDAKHIRVYGLSNLGNTCFYNSALQVSLCTCMHHDAYPWTYILASLIGPVASVRVLTTHHPICWVLLPRTDLLSLLQSCCGGSHTSWFVMMLSTGSLWYV